MEKDILALIEFLKRNKVKYVLTGAFAIGYYARPRATRDIDLVIRVGEDFEEVIGDFSLPVLRNGNKYIVDSKPFYFELWVALSDHDRESVRRGLRRKVVLAGREVFVYLISSENLIISKLLRYSRQDQADIISLLESVDVDLKYIRSWVILNRAVLRRWEWIYKEYKRGTGPTEVL